MTLPVTGLELKRQAEVLQEIITSERLTIDENINVDQDLLLGQINTIVSEQIASNYALLVDVNDSKSLSKAEGTALDDLVSILGIRRQQETPTKGEQYFVVNNNTLLTPEAEASSAATQTDYALQDSITATNNQCRIVEFSVGTVTDNVSYDMTVLGVNFSINSGSSATALSILQALELAFNNSPVQDVQVSIDVDSEQMTVETSDFQDISVVLDSKLSIEQITVAGEVFALTGGAIIQAANTVTIRKSPQSGWLDTYNPRQFITGRSIETDSELRARAQLSASTVGLATTNAIIREVLDIAGVSYCDVIESTETYPSNNPNQPRGSINVVVIGGDNAEVAQTIFTTKAAGVETWGDDSQTGYISETTVDLNGRTYTTDFNRPETVTTYLEVTYQKYDEESFPIDGEVAMAEALVAFGNALGVDRDIDPSQFTGVVYSAVSGIQGVEVKAKIVVSYPFSTTVIPITASQAAIFDVGNVSFNLVT